MYAKVHIEHIYTTKTYTVTSLWIFFKWKLFFSAHIRNNKIFEKLHFPRNPLKIGINFAMEKSHIFLRYFLLCLLTSPSIPDLHDLCSQRNLPPIDPLSFE